MPGPSPPVRAGRGVRTVAVTAGPDVRRAGHGARRPERRPLAGHRPGRARHLLGPDRRKPYESGRTAAGGTGLDRRRDRHRPVLRVAGRLGRHRDRAAARCRLRLPGAARRDSRGGGLRQGDDGAGDRHVRGLHAVHRTSGARPRDAGAGQAVHRGLPRAGALRPVRRRPQAAAEHRPDRARPVHRQLRLRAARPRRPVLPGSGRAGADTGLGRHDQPVPGRRPARRAAVRGRARRRRRGGRRRLQHRRGERRRPARRRKT